MEALPTITVLVLTVAAFAVWVWALADVIRRPEDQLRTGSKLLWAIVVLLGHLAGAVLYLLLGRPGAAPRDTARSSM